MSKYQTFKAKTASLSFLKSSQGMDIKALCEEADLSSYIEHSVQFTCTFEAFRQPQRYRAVSELVKYLAEEVRNKKGLCALL